jgi:hypothetical protein
LVVELVGLFHPDVVELGRLNLFRLVKAEELDGVVAVGIGIEGLVMGRLTVDTILFEQVYDKGHSCHPEGRKGLSADTKLFPMLREKLFNEELGNRVRFTGTCPAYVDNDSSGSRPSSRKD